MSINYGALFADALGFTVAMAWNNAVSNIIGRLYPSNVEGANTRASILYALIITLIVLIVVMSYNHFRKTVQQITGYSVDETPPGSSPPDDTVVRLV